MEGKHPWELHGHGGECIILLRVQQLFKQGPVYGSVRSRQRHGCCFLQILSVMCNVFLKKKSCSCHLANHGASGAASAVDFEHKTWSMTQPMLLLLRQF